MFDSLGTEKFWILESTIEDAARENIEAEVVEEKVNKFAL